MHEQIITIYCLCDDFLHAYGHSDDPQARMSTAEVMTSALVAAWFFEGHHARACQFLKEHGYIPTMLSPSRFNRRLHQIEETCWQALFYLIARIYQLANESGDYIVDSCPVPVCHNLHIKRCKLYRHDAFRGYCASKRSYFYGLKIHLVVTGQGCPVDITLTPGSVADMPGLRSLFLDLPDGASLYGDKAYTDYTLEDLLTEISTFELVAARKSNSKRPHAGHVSYLCQVIRKRVETTFSGIAKHFARSIHAVTARGFELKVFLTVLAYSVLG